MCVVLVFLLCAASMDASPTARVPSAVAADFTMGGTNQNISDSDGVLTESDASAVAATLALCRTFRTLVAILGRMDGHPTPTAVAFCRDVLSGLRASLSGSTVLLFLSVEDRQVCLCGTDSTVVPEYVASVIVGHMRRDLTRGRRPPWHCLGPRLPTRPSTAPCRECGRTTTSAPAVACDVLAPLALAVGGPPGTAPRGRISSPWRREHPVPGPVTLWRVPHHSCLLRDTAAPRCRRPPPRLSARPHRVAEVAV